jgi:hypothetical protein
LKIPTQKRAGGVAQGIGPEFKSQYWRGKKKSRRPYVKHKLKAKGLGMWLSGRA